MKDFVVNIIIVGIALVMYYFGVLDLFTAKYTIWVVLFIIFLLFLAALKILGNPFAKGKDND